MRARRRLLVLLAAGGWGCVYYNGLWNAHRFAAEARQHEREGRPDAAVVSWSVSAAEAESVAVHHPHSRWLPDALATAAEALAGSRDCTSLGPYVDRIPTVTTDAGILERAALARASCALQSGDVDGAEAWGRPVLSSKDEDRRNRAALLVGRAERGRGRFAEAAAVLARSPERAAGVEEVLALVAAGRVEQADSLCDALVRRKPLEEDWDSIFAAFAQSAGATVTSRVVGRVLQRAKLTQGERARLYLADGDRLLESRFPAAADNRFRQAEAAAPDSVEADKAQVGRLWARVAQAVNTDSLPVFSAELGRLAATGGAGGDARHLQTLVNALGGPDTSVTGAFRAGEMARDSLYADPLAAALLLGFARRHPGSLFAPKALVAAIPLSPGHADSLTRELEVRYSTSPYSLALRGAPSPGFDVAEDSLARLFGIRSVALPAIRGPRFIATWSPPQTGKRGPLLNPPEVAPQPRALPQSPNAAGRRGVADTLK